MVLVPKPPPPPQFTNVTTINFDDVPDSTVIDNHYASKGVTFASITTNPQKQWNAYARASVAPVTHPNVVSLHKIHVVGFDAFDGGIEVTFLNPQRFVGIAARAAVIDEVVGNRPITRPFIQFYHFKGKFLPVTQYYPFVFADPNWGSVQQLSYLAPTAEIGKVVFSCEFDPAAVHRVFGLFDHLVFSEDIPYFPPIPLGAGGQP